MSNIRKINDEEFFSLKTNEEKIKFLLRYAILAPSTHNSQPWLFKIKASSCEIHKNMDRILPITDKIERDMYISFGCLIENLILTSEYFSVYQKMTYKAETKKDSVIAEIFFKDLDKNNKPKNEMKELLRAVLIRANRRGLFENKNISTSILNNLKKLNKNYSGINLHLITDKNKRETLSDLTAQGLREAYRNNDFRREMSGWFINNFSSRKDGIPGYAINMPNLLSILFPTVIRFFNVGKAISKLNRKSIISAPLIIVITGAKNDLITWIEVGRLSERIMLELVKEEISTSIYVASVEIGNLYKNVQKLLSTREIPQFLFCAGYINSPPIYTPRHSIKNKII